MGTEVKAVDAEEKKTVVPLHYPINYGYYGHYSPLTHYYGKREAEAEPTADADADAKADRWPICSSLWRSLQLRLRLQRLPRCKDRRWQAHRLPPHHLPPPWQEVR